jgi:hypothetical protein
MRKELLVLATIIAGCSDTAAVGLPASHYELIRVAGIATPAEVEHVPIGNNTFISRVVYGAIALTRPDSARFILHTESATYDSMGVPLASQSVCNNLTVAHRVSGGRLYLDLEYVAPPSQGAFAIRMHDTLSIHGDRLTGNHKMVFAVSSLATRTFTLEFVARSGALPPC